VTPKTAARIRSQIETMRAIVRSPDLSARNERVSGWSVAEHVDHMYKVAMSIVRRLADASAEPLPRGVNFLGRLVLLFGWIPRGRGKSPSRLIGTRADGAEIDAALLRLERELDALPPEGLRTSRGKIVPHPLFGALTPPQALRFIVVHTRHHLKIIREIQGRAES
jgi:hypothetical protein